MIDNIFLCKRVLNMYLPFFRVSAILVSLALASCSMFEGKSLEERVRENVDLTNAVDNLPDVGEYMIQEPYTVQWEQYKGESHLVVTSVLQLRSLQPLVTEDMWDDVEKEVAQKGCQLELEQKFMKSGVVYRTIFKSADRDNTPLAEVYVDSNICGNID